MIFNTNDHCVSSFESGLFSLVSLVFIVVIGTCIHTGIWATSFSVGVNLASTNKKAAKSLRDGIIWAFCAHKLWRMVAINPFATVGGK